MTVETNPFPEINAPPLSALRSLLRDGQKTRQRRDRGEVDGGEPERAAPLSGWPRIFPGL
jgi:hypothetical protein